MTAINQFFGVRISEGFFERGAQSVITWIRESYNQITELFARAVNWFVCSNVKPTYVLLLELENVRIKGDNKWLKLNRDFYSRGNRFLRQQLAGMRALSAEKDLQIQAIRRQLELARG